jgi:hypothetical protein
VVWLSVSYHSPWLDVMLHTPSILQLLADLEVYILAATRVALTDPRQNIFQTWFVSGVQGVSCIGLRGVAGNGVGENVLLKADKGGREAHCQQTGCVQIRNYGS